MKIQDCLTENPEIISPNTTIGEAAKKMRERDIGALFVSSNDKLVGIVTDRDIVVRGLSEGINLDATVENIMTPKILYCYNDETVEAVAENFAKNQVHRLPVLDRNKRLVGVISIGDLSRHRCTNEVCTACMGIHRAHAAA